ncbi:mannose receptor, C type 1a [Elysia marginata]|uniref:Mannose receptor, C type 1a n=1 Tax=Elysia marginata TaxID=1093978 RepID=A0AAV4IWL3_9GAST|nr:mannose receptor, C type 1a [Elysia marginata]
MNEFVGTLIENLRSDYFWIGSMRYGEGTFMWVKISQNVTFTNWAKNQPNIQSSCATIEKDSAKWRDNDCTMKFRSICEVVPEKLCLDGWTPSSASQTCIKVYYHQQETWTSAREVCQQDGADLVAILNDQMEGFLEDQVKSFQHGFWIGLSDRNIPANFQWLGYQGQINFTNWGAHEPSKTGCVELVKSVNNRHGAVWMVQQCEKQQGFICEKFADCSKEENGMVCPDPCFNCMELNETCDRRTGECFHGCNIGFQGEKCDDECSNGTFGLGCSENCSLHCGGPYKTCNKTTGICLDGCVDGFVGEMCEAGPDMPVTATLYFHAAIAGSLLLIASILLGFLLPKLGRETEVEEATKSFDPLDYEDRREEPVTRISIDSGSGEEVPGEAVYRDRSFDFRRDNGSASYLAGSRHSLRASYHSLSYGGGASAENIRRDSSTDARHGEGSAENVRGRNLD